MFATDNEPIGAWYALYTRHQHEKAVENVLRYKGFEVFLPLYVTAHRWKDRYKEVSLPLFPCYVFIKSQREYYSKVLATPGVHSFVTNAGEPIPLSSVEVDAMRRTVEGGTGVEPHPFLACGDWVRVTSGYLQGVEGILVQKKNLHRLVISVEMLGKAASVEIDGFLVERISNNQRRAPEGASRVTVGYSN